MKRKMRRKFIKIIGFSFFSLIFQPVAFLYSQTKKLINPNLSDKQKSIMFKEATERPFSSPLNNEKRQAYYHCANCGAKLFSSSAKFDSGTGWPSFTESLPGAFKTKIDNSLINPHEFYLLKYQIIAKPINANIKPPTLN